MPAPPCNLAIEQGKHSAQSVAPPQGRNADRQTLANIIGVMDRRTLILLQHPNFAGDAYEYTRLDCLVSFLRNHSQPQHEFIDPEIEELRSAFRNNVIQFLAIAQTLTQPLADDLGRFSLSPTLRHAYPDQYIYHATCLTMQRLRHLSPINSSSAARGKDLKREGRCVKICHWPAALTTMGQSKSS